MNGKNFNNYAIVKVPKKQKAPEINAEELVREAKEKGVPYTSMNVTVPADKLFDPLLYCPSNDGISTTKPFNPFYFVRDELIPIYAKCGQAMKWSKLNHINCDYGESIIMDNICIILQYGLIGFLKQFITEGREKEFYDEYNFCAFQAIRSSVNYALGCFFTEYKNPKSEYNCDPYSTKNIPTIVYIVCTGAANHLSKFIQNIISLGCIDIKKLNTELNKVSARMNNGVIINEEDIDCDVSMIISYLTYVSRCNIEQISEAVELCVAGTIDFAFTANNLYNENKSEDDPEKHEVEYIDYQNYA